MPKTVNAYFLYTCLFLNIALAQNIVVKHYGVTDGLPSSECYWVTQDSKHFLWIATDAGVVKYDGYKFTTYNSAKGLPDNTVFKIHEDKYGRIWFSTYSGKFAYYKHETDSVYTVPINKKLSEIIKILPIDFCFDTADTLLISVALQGYIKVIPPLYDKYTAHHFNEGFFIKEGSATNFIYGSYKKQTLTYNFVPFYFQGYDQKNFNFKAGDSMASNASLTSSIKLKNKNYLFSNGICTYEISKERVKKSLNYRKDYKGFVINIFEDSKKNVWLGTTNNGALVFENAHLNTTPKQFLPNNIVSCIFEDIDYGYWFTTTNNGLNYIPSTKYNFFNNTNGLSSDKVYAISILDNKLYCAVNDLKLNILDLDTKIFTYKTDFKFAYNFKVDNSLLFTNDMGTYLLDTKTNRIDTFINKTGILRNLYIKKAIEFDKDNIVCYDNQFNIIKINKATKKNEVLIKFPTRIYSICKNKDELFIGAKNGLYCYKNNKLYFLGDNIPLLANRIEAMTSTDGMLFLATKGFGVLCYKNNKIAAQFNETNGLASNICKCITNDSIGNIWVGTNRGVSMLNKDSDGNYKCNSLNLSNGLISNEINQLIAFKNQLYLATNNGIAMFDIKEAFDEKKSIPVYIEDFFVNNEKMDFMHPQTFRYNQNFIKINYKGIFLREEGNINYKYKLDGLDTSWTYTKNTFVQFTTLPAGSYKFIVYTINAGNVITSSPAVISFCINKPFWRATWFIILVTLLIVLLFYLWYKKRISEIRQKEKLKALFNKQLVESELKALRSQMNPHFIFNAINSIQNFVIKNESVEAQKYLTKFSRLIRSVLENSKYETILLNDEIVTLSLYLELEALRASFGFDYKIEIEEQVKNKTIYIPTMLIQPYIENAILHGVLPLQDRRGKLTISFEVKEQHLICTIDDNGIGREKAREIKQNKNLNHDSMGMSVTSQRIDNLNKYTSVQTTVTIIDKVNEKINGTTVILKIKI